MICPHLHRNPANVPRRSGFTILELLLALAVLLTLAALVVPNFGTLLADRQITRGGDQVRVEMMQARLAAMRNGRTYMMQLQPGSRRLRIRPWVDAGDMTEAVDQTGGSQGLLMGGSAVGGSLQAVDVEGETRNIELPENVVALDVRVQSTPRSYMIEMQVASTNAEGWSKPILFYADGSTSTAAVSVGREGVGKVSVLLRSLTGEVTVTDLFAHEAGTTP